MVHTKDSRGKLLVRRYFVKVADLLGEDQFTDESVISVPEDGTIRTNFNREIVLDLRTNEAQIEAGYFPCNLLFNTIDAIGWFGGHSCPNILQDFTAKVIQPLQSYQIPAIDLDRRTDKAAVATVFEKVNVGGLPLNVFELLTAVFAGDKSFYDQNGKDFRLNDDWLAIKQSWQGHDALGKVENTDFLQAITLLATFERSKQAIEGRKLGVSAKREDILQLDLENYLRWREPLTHAFIWSANFLADDHIFKAKDVPYPKQLVPLAALRVVLGEKADHYSVKNRIRQWYWAGVLGELYGSAIETRFVRDLEAVPAWAMQEEDAGTPRTIQDASFIESRLHSIRTRNSAAYKGIAALTTIQSRIGFANGIGPVFWVSFMARPLKPVLSVTSRLFQTGQPKQKTQALHELFKMQVSSSLGSTPSELEIQLHTRASRRSSWGTTRRIGSKIRPLARFTIGI